MNTYQVHELKKTQRALKRQTPGISLKDHKISTYIRSITKIRDSAETVAELKWSYAAHVSTYTDETWFQSVLKWRRYMCNRSRGCPKHWTDGINQAAVFKRLKQAQNRQN